MGAQWLNIRGFVPRPIQAVARSSITGVTELCPWARHINPCLVVQPRTTRPGITENNVLLDIRIKSINKGTCSIFMNSAYGQINVIYT